MRPRPASKVTSGPKAAGSPGPARLALFARPFHDQEDSLLLRRRDNRSTVSGKATLRYGHAEVFGDPCGVAAEVAAVLQAHGWAGQMRRCGPECRAPSPVIRKTL
jgi:hypothetical protein